MLFPNKDLSSHPHAFLYTHGSIFLFQRHTIFILVEYKIASIRRLQLTANNKHSMNSTPG
jgi:hypothetical protein